MTATQPRVRVEQTFTARCPGCGWTYENTVEGACNHLASLHEKACPTFRLAALLASLETLRDQWRVAGDGNNSEGRAFRHAADDLHRVIEGARG